MIIKRISPVLAIVLLILITVAMVGFAFVWFQSFLNIDKTQEMPTCIDNSCSDTTTTIYPGGLKYLNVTVPSDIIAPFSDNNTQIYILNLTYPYKSYEIKTDMTWDFNSTDAAWANEKISYVMDILKLKRCYQVFQSVIINSVHYHCEESVYGNRLFIKFKR